LPLEIADREFQEVGHRRQAAKAILKAVAENHCEDPLSLFQKGDGTRSAASLGWDCEELVIRTGAKNSEQENENFSGEIRGKVGNVQLEAKLTSSMLTVLRYQSALKRDLYRAIATLRNIKEQRSGQDH
jgi:hypothetical protein